MPESFKDLLYCQHNDSLIDADEINKSEKVIENEIEDMDERIMCMKIDEKGKILMKKI